MSCEKVIFLWKLSNFKNCRSWIDDARTLRLGDSSTDFLDYLSTFEKFLQIHFHGDKSAKIRGSDNSHSLDGRICLSCRKIIRSLTQNVEADNKVESQSFDKRRRHSIIFGDLVQPEIDEEDFTRGHHKTKSNHTLKNVPQKTILSVFSAKKSAPKLLKKPSQEKSTDLRPEDLAGSANKLLSNEILRLLITNVIRKENGGAKLLNEVRKAQKTLSNYEKSAEFDQLLAVLLDAIMSQSMKQHHDVPVSFETQNKFVLTDNTLRIFRKSYSNRFGTISRLRQLLRNFHL